jgi:flagellar motor component MotA
VARICDFYEEILKQPLINIELNFVVLENGWNCRRLRSISLTDGIVEDFVLSPLRMELDGIGEDFVLSALGMELEKTSQHSRTSAGLALQKESKATLILRIW